MSGNRTKKERNHHLPARQVDVYKLFYDSNGGIMCPLNNGRALQMNELRATDVLVV